MSEESHSQKPIIYSPHDLLFKDFLSDIRVAQDFLEAHLSEEVKIHCDWSTLAIQPTNFVDPELRQYFLDMLYSVKIKGSDGLIMFLIEHETTPSELSLWYMHRYLVLSIEHYRKQHPEETKLPIVVPLLLYRGKRSPYPYSMSLMDRFVDPELARRVWCEPYTLIDLNVIPDDTLRRHKSAALFELVQKNVDRRNVMELLEDFLGYLVSSYVSHEKLKALLCYIAEVGNRSECKQFFETISKRNIEYGGQVMNFAQELREEGLQKGMAIAQQWKQEGMQERTELIAQSMLLANEPIEKIMRYTGLSEAEINTLDTKH